VKVIKTKAFYLT